MAFVKDNQQMPLSIQLKASGNGQHITHKAQGSQFAKGRDMAGQFEPGPGDEIVGELRQQDEHHLGREEFLVTLGQAQSLLAVLVDSLDARS